MVVDGGPASFAGTSRIRFGGSVADATLSARKALPGGVFGCGRSVARAGLLTAHGPPERAEWPYPRTGAVADRVAMTERITLSADTTVARLRAERASGLASDRLCAALDDPSWLGAIGDPPPNHPELRRIETDLAFDLTEERRTVTFRKAAFVDIGPVRRNGANCIAQIAWRASSLAPLFPVFAGTIEASDGLLVLDGVYAPPGGGVGLLVDRGFLHVFARRTANWFLDRLVSELGSPTR